MNRWTLTDELRDKFEPVLNEYFDKIENFSDEEVEKINYEELTIDFSDKGINPWQLKTLLEEFGYEEVELDNNGWQLDFWISMTRRDSKRFNSTCENIVIEGCGMTFELKLYIDRI